LRIKAITGRFPWLIDRINYVRQLSKLLKHLKADDNPWKIPISSRDSYDAYDDSEQRAFYGEKKLLCRDGDRNIWATEREARDRYLAPVEAEIRSLLETAEKVSVLEIGCGNCINIMLLKERFGERIDLHGVDISTGRINVAKEFFGEKLEGVPLWIESVADPTPEEQKGRYDLVFSMHCLEQIPYAAVPAVQGLWERARQRVVMVEPVWEFARPAQRLKLVRNDFIRTLLPAVKYLGYDVAKAEPLGFESSQNNQSSLIVLNK